MEGDFKSTPEVIASLSKTRSQHPESCRALQSVRWTAVLLHRYIVCLVRACFNHNGKAVRSGSWYWLSTYKPVQHRTVCGTLGLRASRQDCATWQLHPRWLNRCSRWREFVAASPTRRTITGLMPTFLLGSLRGAAVAPAGHFGWSVEGPQRQGVRQKVKCPGTHRRKVFRPVARLGNDYHWHLCFGTDY